MKKNGKNGGNGIREGLPSCGCCGADALWLTHRRAGVDGCGPECAKCGQPMTVCAVTEQTAAGWKCLCPGCMNVAVKEWFWARWEVPV